MDDSHLVEGRLGERIACRYLLRAGFDVLARRYRSRSAEIDLIAFDGETLVFVEVKTRATAAHGQPWEFVEWEQKQRLGRAAAEFIARYDLGAHAFRFDVVSVVAPGTPSERIAHQRGAF